MRTILFLLGFIPFLMIAQSSDSSKFEKFQFVDFNGYYDTRNLNVFTLNAKLDFSSRFSYFTVMNFFSDPEKRDMNGYYMEHHLYYKLFKEKSLDLTQYWISVSGLANDHLRYGLRWRLHDANGLRNFFNQLNLKLFAAIYPISFCEEQSPQYFTQAQYVYRIKLFNKKLDNRLYLGGFANQYWDARASKNPFSWVTEHQLGLRIWKGLHGVVELRYNAFWPQSKGIGFGFEYFQTL